MQQQEKPISKHGEGLQRRKEHYQNSYSQSKGMYSSHHNDDYYQPPLSITISLETNLS